MSKTTGPATFKVLSTSERQTIESRLPLRPSTGVVGKKVKIQANLFPVTK
jgi:hypothetical protein